MGYTDQIDKIQREYVNLNNKYQSKLEDYTSEKQVVQELKIKNQLIPKLENKINLL